MLAIMPQHSKTENMSLRVGLLSGETEKSWGVAADLVSPLELCSSPGR